MDARRYELAREAEDLAASFDALVLVLSESDQGAPGDQVSGEMLRWMKATQRRLDWELRRNGAKVATRRPVELALAGD